MRISSGAYLLIGGAAWSVMASIENRGYLYPEHPSGSYTTALQIKGVERFVTPAEATRDHVAHWVFFGAVATGFVVFGIIIHRRNRRAKA
jgi:hypothetical protein